MMEYKNIIFDVDGTLLDTYKTAYKAKEQTLKDFNIPVVKELIDKGFSLTSKESLEIFGIDLNTDMGKKIMARESKYYDEYSKYISLFKDVKEVLKTLKAQNKKIGIITARTFEELTSESHISPILNWFDIIITASDVTRPKPNRESFDQLFYKTNFKRWETLYVGDSLTDSTLAKSSQVDFALALWGCVDGSIDAKYKLKSIKELID